MKVNFKSLQDYLNSYGYPYNEMMYSDDFDIPDQTSYEYLMKNISKYQNIDAMTFYGQRIKYSEFSDEINKTANGLQAIGLSNKDRIAILLPNIPEAAYVQYGASKIGAVPSNIDPRTTGKMLLNYIRNEHIKGVIVVDVMYKTAILPIEHELKEEYGIDKVIVVPATNSMPIILKKVIALKSKLHHINPITSTVLEVIYWNDMISNSKYENALNIDFTPNCEAVIQHSSGTLNGIPKSIPLTNENINSFVEKHLPTTIVKELSWGTKMLNVLPYFASYGAINTSHLGFNLGLTLQQIPEFQFKDFGYIAYKQKSEVLIGTPTWFSLATCDTRLKKDALKNVKIAISGGDGMDEKTKDNINRFFKEHGAKCKVTNGHGMSELSGSGCYQFLGHDNNAGVGIPFPYDKYIIMDDDGKIVPMTESGVKGCTWIYSPSATAGVFDGQRFAETKDINGFRFLNSKDTMLIMPNNEITYIEREDRAFARFDGHKIIPYDIECKFMSHKLIKHCMVVPYFDSDINGKMPIAYIVPEHKLKNQELDLLVSEIVNLLLESENTNSRDVPRKICCLSELPINAMSKNDFRNLANRELDGTEYTVNISETNLSSGEVKIIPPTAR